MKIIVESIRNFCEGFISFYTKYLQGDEKLVSFTVDGFALLQPA